MAKANINCPVCGEALENGLCPKCGYLRLVFPEAIPEQLKRQELMRVATAKKRIEEIDSLQKQNKTFKQQSEQTIDNLRQIIQDKTDLSEQSDKEISDLKIKLKGVESDIRKSESLQADTNAKLRKMESKLEQSESEIEGLTKIIGTKNSEIEKLKRELAESSHSNANAFLILIDDGEYFVMPVGDTITYFATGPGMNLCPIPESQVVMLPVMTSLRAAFSIAKSDTGAYRLTDLNGNIKSSGSFSGNKFRLTQGVSINIEGSRMQMHFCIHQQ